MGWAAVAAAVFAAPQASIAKPQKKVNVKVMTRNLYLGADLNRAIAAATPEQAYAETGEILDRVYDTNFDARVKPLVGEIKAKNPDLVGMQEVALWRKGQFGSPTRSATPGTEVVFDYLADLKEEMRKQDLDYKAVHGAAGGRHRVPGRHLLRGSSMATATTARPTARPTSTGG